MMDSRQWILGRSLFLRRGLLAYAALLLPFMVPLGCKHAQGMSALEPSVKAYHRHLKWKRFGTAAQFLHPSARRAFLRAYGYASDDLHVDDIQITGVEFLSPTVGAQSDEAAFGAVDTQEDTAEVVAVARAYLLPSTELRKRVMVERWRRLKGGWQLVAVDSDLLGRTIEEDDVLEGNLE